jgi:hypothetical protein
MKVIWLIITFIGIDGLPYTANGWGPREQPSIDVCVVRKAFVEDYLTINPPPPTIMAYRVSCIEVAN